MLLIPRGGESTRRFGIWLGYLVLSPFWTSVWRSFPRALVTDEDFRAWPFSVGLLVKFSHFLARLRWPESAHDLGVGGVSYLELLFLYERLVGERPVLEKVLPYGRRAGRPISVSAVPVGPGIDIWRSCRFIGSIFLFLDRLPGGFTEVYSLQHWV